MDSGHSEPAGITVFKRKMLNEHNQPEAEGKSVMES